MKYKIIHLFVKLTNLFQSKIVTTKVNKKIFFLFFIIAVIAMQLRTFTRFRSKYLRASFAENKHIHLRPD
jgi:hypothetical protein